MEKLIDILNKHEVEEHEVAEMIYAYLDVHGETTDSRLIEEIYNQFLKGN